MFGLSRTAAPLWAAALLTFASSCARKSDTQPEPQPEPTQPVVDDPILPEPECTPDVPAARLLRLSPIWHANAMAALFGEAPSAPTLPPVASETISEHEVEALSEAARAFVVRAGHLRFLSCNVDGVFDEVCFREFIDAFATRAFRRPIEPEERETLLALAEGLRNDASIDPPITFRELTGVVAQVIAQSPQMVYLLDEGVSGDVGAESAPVGLRRTTGYERAAHLSFFLTD